MTSLNNYFAQEFHGRMQLFLDQKYFTIVMQFNDEVLIEDKTYLTMQLESVSGCSFASVSVL